ncbi:MAG: bifunctional hydroxymethylpyrimidine kinase/phosphomethylpyrimidine kinase [Planctomycetota bacterium]|jgi:hydroxymethylpyrimidine/phosphomethylpyrimidine kinase
MDTATPLRIALTIAGSDPSGGAGIQADLKSFHAHGVYGEAVLVALTAQNTRGVTGVHEVPVEFVLRQLDAVFDDIPPHAVKTGMLATAALVEAVAGAMEHRGVEHLVVDPVMVATSGARLLEEDAVDAVRERLVPLAEVVTPNLPEAALLADMDVNDAGSAEEAGRRIVGLGARAALVKGGHGDGGAVVDVLVTGDGAVHRFEHPRIESTSTHGTGCTLSASVAAGLALGRGLQGATEQAVDYVRRAIESAPGLGGGHGPVNHLVTGA